MKKLIVNAMLLMFFLMCFLLFYVLSEVDEFAGLSEGKVTIFAC